MSRLIIVSNRVTPISGSKAATAGGLAVGVLAALRESGGIWFGWSGETIEAGAPMPKVFRTGNITYITIDLQQTDFDRYYGGFSNRALWPLFHYRLDLSSFDREWYIGYRRVNQLFAEELYPYLRDDDLIWVHDYQLIPLGEELRQLGIHGRIGFFLHIPFPSTEVYVALPWHDRLAPGAETPTIWSAFRPATICAISTTISTGRGLATPSPTVSFMPLAAPSGRRISRSELTPRTSPRWRPRRRRCGPASAWRAASSGAS